jgi:hypothetical protein
MMEGLELLHLAADFLRDLRKSRKPRVVVWQTITLQKKTDPPDWSVEDTWYDIEEEEVTLLADEEMPLIEQVKLFLEKYPTLEIPERHRLLFGARVKLYHWALVEGEHAYALRIRGRWKLLPKPIQLLKREDSVWFVGDSKCLAPEMPFNKIDDKKLLTWLSSQV